jgi:glutathione S-transferase
MHPAAHQIRDAIIRSTDGLTEQQMRNHPEGKWDTAAILEHLALTYGSTARVMQKCLKEARPLATSATVRHRVARSLVLRFSYIPTGRKAPKQVVPSGIAGKEALEMIYANLEKMDEAFAQCEQSFGTRCKIADHPVLGPIPISGWRKFHVLHTLHHMKQIDALRKQYAGAKSGVAGAS